VRCRGEVSSGRDSERRIWCCTGIRRQWWERGGDQDWVGKGINQGVNQGEWELEEHCWGIREQQPWCVLCISKSKEQTALCMFLYPSRSGGHVREPKRGVVAVSGGMQDSEDGMDLRIPIGGWCYRLLWDLVYLWSHKEPRGTLRALTRLFSPAF